MDRQMSQEYRQFWQLTGTIYTLVTVSIGLATTVYFAVSKNKPSHAEFHEIFFTVLYCIGTLAVGMLFWRARCSNGPRRTAEIASGEGGGADHAESVPLGVCHAELDNNDGENKAAADEDVADYYVTTDQSPPEVIFTGEGFNVYLRIGLVVFVSGVVAFNILRCVAQLIHPPPPDQNCRRAVTMLMNLLEVAFTASQAAFIIRHHRAIFLRRKAQSRMALAHLFTANICIWASSAIGEIKEQLTNTKHAFGDRPGGGGGNSTIPESGDASCEASWRLIDMVRPFLTPAVIEYCLLAAPMVLHMLVSVGDSRAVQKHLRQLRSIRPGGAELSAITTSSSDVGCLANLRLHFARSRMGLAFCLVALAVTAGVTIAVYQFLNGQVATVVYLAQDLLLNTIGIGLCVFMHRSMRRLGLAKSERHSFDDKLLIFALFGSMVYQVTMMVIIMDHTDLFLPVYMSAELVHLLICAVQLSIQTFCLLDALRRRARSPADAREKPGSGMVLALLGLNLSLWIMETFEVRKVEELLFSYQLGNVPLPALKILLHVGQPINIFYRFHSTVCLSIIWLKAYEPQLLESDAEA